MEKMEFISSRDYPVAYAKDQLEFKNLMQYLHEHNLIVATKMYVSSERAIYRNVTLTEKGIKEAEKELPRMPMMGLVNEEIATVDFEIDGRINHAKKLFFSQQGNLENMRSACEALSHVMEPLRDDCKKYFGRKDTDVIFNMVNDYNIQHNKSYTKDIQYPEQFEWVFYGLLNTINTYAKLKMRLK